ncbi:MAG: phosphoadenosine phosphosulfate reductase family protein [Parabacteroides sp.]|nr:phosphoadenosine phosphosulfate reductase family protein [Parabacteroides sp.]
MTEYRIRQWYENYGGDVYISFSGGKDSTVLLDIARNLYSDIEAVFIDTGLEYPEVRKFAKSFDNVTVVRPELNFKQVILKYGYPVVSKEQSQYIMQYRNATSEKTKDTRWNGNKYGRGKISEKWKYLVDAPFLISDKCCNVMKKAPAKKYEHDTGKKPIIATMAFESKLRESQWLQSGCNAFEATRPISKPMSFWTEQDVLQYVTEHNLKLAKPYGHIIEDIDSGDLKTTGCERTGCMFCMYGCHLDGSPNRFDRMKKTDPKIYEYCMKDLEEGGLGLRNVLDYYLGGSNE